MKSVINYCYWVVVFFGDNGDMKQQKWLFFVEYVVNKYDLCMYGELDGEG